MIPANLEKYIEGIQGWRDVLMTGGGNEGVVRYLRRKHGTELSEVDDEDLLSYFEGRRRYRKIMSEQKLWCEAIERYADDARRAGYKVTPLDGGMWKIETAKMRTILESDAELYLFLVDRDLVKVKMLHRRWTGETP